MNPQRTFWQVTLPAAVCLVALHWWRSGTDVEPAGDAPPAPAVAESIRPRDPEPPGTKERSFVVRNADPMVGRVGAGLNAADGSVQRDLAILQEVLAAWRANAMGEGNPVGDNQDITATLTGRNRWGFSIIPPDHPAINDAGELCDRWGTPLFFHQLSGERMEIISLGPDRRKGTADDVKVVP